MRIPIYLDGKPANLSAAILDAEYWLRWLRSQINDARLPAEAEMKRTVSVGLRSAIQVLTEFLPDEGLTPVQQAKVDLIKEKLRAKQRVRATE